MMNYILYLFYLFFLRIFSLLPFWIIYLFSDLLFYLIYYIVGYRKKVVRYNLTSSFPEKDEKEILYLEKKYYRHLCDILVESFKGQYLSKKQLYKRYKFTNFELTDKFIKEGKSVLILPSHLNNWEWGTMATGTQLKAPIVIIYHKLSNKWIDNQLKKSRSKYNSIMTSMSETSRAFKQFVQNPHYFILTADQYPSNLKYSNWVYFLNKNTPWFSGPALYANKYNMPVYYYDIIKIKRGYYEIEFKKITDDPKSLSWQELTEKYVSFVEKSIEREPAHWIWSHKRWKNIKGINGEMINPYKNL